MIKQKTHFEPLKSSAVVAFALTRDAVPQLLRYLSRVSNLSKLSIACELAYDAFGKSPALMVTLRKGGVWNDGSL